MRLNYLSLCLFAYFSSKWPQKISNCLCNHLLKQVYIGKKVPTVQLDNRGEEVDDIKINEWRIKTWVCWQLWLLVFPVIDTLNFEILTEWCKWVNPLDTEGMNPFDINYWSSLDPAAQILPLRKSLEHKGVLMLVTEQEGIPDNSVWSPPLWSK